MTEKQTPPSYTFSESFPGDKKRNFIILGIIIGLVYWVAESVFHVFFLNFLEPHEHEIWMRLWTVTFIIAFSVYAQQFVRQRQRDKRLIEEKNRFLIAVLDALKFPFVVIDAKDYSIKAANKTAKRINLKEGNFCYISRHGQKQPCDGKEYPCPVRVVKKTKKATIVEHLYCNNEGKQRVEEVFAFPLFNNEGEVDSIIEYTHDITERKRTREVLVQNEKRLRLMANALPVLIAYIDKGHYYRFHNCAYEEWLGRDGNKIDNYHMRDVIGEELYLSVKKYVEEVLSGNEVRFHKVISNAGGSMRHVELSYIPYLGADQQVEGFYSMVYDVTDRLKAEAELKLQREELNHMTRVATLGELAASIAHEINQPLSAIVSNAQAAKRFSQKEDVKTEEIQETLADIIDDGIRAGQVIHRLRALLKKEEPVREGINVNEIVYEIVHMLKSETVIKKVKVNVDCSEPIPLVGGDRVQVQQVVLNLFLNGIETVMSRDPEDRVLDIWTSGREQGMVQVAVKDSGAGIIEDRDKLFRPFYTTKQDGMGMGLSICRSIIESHGGELWLENNQGQGATAYFSLPVHKEEMVCHP
ncbi:MAG: PAS domain-containing protein [Candidatus Omnitrophica bacterium]|nr:PAS domain-containing protein [Candidatus Omnitrophota bacterium]